MINEPIRKFADKYGIHLNDELRKDLLRLGLVYFSKVEILPSLREDFKDAMYRNGYKSASDFCRKTGYNYDAMVTLLSGQVKYINADTLELCLLLDIRFWHYYDEFVMDFSNDWFFKYLDEDG